MKYQLVALFDHESSLKVERIQKNLCKKYKLYRNGHVLHIPIVTLTNPDVEKIDDIIAKLLEPYKKFKVKINNGVYVNTENKQVSVIIDEKGYVSRISRNIDDTLSLYGFNTEAAHSAHSNLFIPVAGINYNIKKACNHEVIPIRKNIITGELLKYAKIDRLELWKLSGHKKDSVVTTFNLREY